MTKTISKLCAVSILILGAIAQAKSVTPTPELQAALQKITDQKVTKVEDGRSGITSTYEVDFDVAANPSVKEIEVTQKDFAVIEAEGNSLIGGSFNPGQGLKSLGELSLALQKYPAFAAEKWELEKKIAGKWIYEVSGRENGTEKEYVFDAKNLELLKTKKD